MLTVRKRNTARFMLPGGKPEPDESAAEAAVRECAEEVGATLDVGALRPLGVFLADAANEPGWKIEGTVFEHPSVPIVGSAAEIEELRWLDPSLDPLPGDLAPLLEHFVLPALAR